MRIIFTNDAGDKVLGEFFVFDLKPGQGACIDFKYHAVPGCSPGSAAPADMRELEKITAEFSVHQSSNSDPITLPEADLKFSMEKPKAEKLKFLLAEVYTDNGEYSHHEIVIADTGEVVADIVKGDDYNGPVAEIVKIRPEYKA